MSAKRRILMFVCKRGRTRDVPLLREGARAAGYAFVLVLVPLAYPALLVAALLRALGVDIFVIFSDYFAGDAGLARLFGAKAARMLWNYADEFPGCLTSAPDKRVCFFGDRSQPVQLFRFAPQPEIRPRHEQARREVVFVGDVTKACALPQGLAWWEERLSDLMQREGYGFYLGDEYRYLLARELGTPAEQRLAKVLTKNLLRLWIVQAAQREFGERIVVVGSNWRRFGVKAAPSMYSLEARLSMYAAAAVQLDCGSKSGDSALYPRASELISYSGAPLQVVCADSALVFGERSREVVFGDEATLKRLIAQRLQEPEALREERSQWITAHLQSQRLTMSDSLRGLLDGADRARAPLPC